MITSCSNNQEVEKNISRISTIPDYAFFVKGNNDGYWCRAEVHSHRNNAFISIYDFKTGKLIKSKRFSVICIVHDNPLWIEDLSKQIDYFDGKKFHLKRLPGQDSCWLE